ncbi:hypothetical protein H0H87_003408 [Tephrocybe sp. NHM501043]|nr:hypothetical protein H0H87_003408 [Tephrocybe sp. NHM501043]
MRSPLENAFTVVCALAALAIPAPRRRTHSNASNVSLPPLSSWSDGRRPLSSFSSSPPRSSSPPMTPSSSASHGLACIRSSPAFGEEITRNVSVDAIDEPSSTLQHSVSKATSQRPLLGIKSLFVDGAPTVHPTHPAVSKFSPGCSAPQQHDTRPSNSRSNPNQYTSVFMDSEDEEQEDSDSEGFSFVGADLRSTFFRVSAERGQWRFDPPRPRALTRQSAPTSSPPPISGLKLIARPISEPAPSTDRVLTPPPSHAEAEDPDQSVEEVHSGNVEIVESPMEPANLPPSIPDVRESMSVYPDSEGDPGACMSSPLPPSSPPLSSLPGSPIMRSISPLSFAPSSPRLPPSSPLSFLDSLPPDEDVDMDMEVQSDDEADTVPTLHSKPSLEPNPTSTSEDSQVQDPEHAPVSSTSPSTFSLPLSLFEPEPESTSSPGPSTETEPPAEPHPSANVPVASEGLTSLVMESPEEEKTDVPCGDVGDIDIAVISVAKELFADELGRSTPSIVSSSSSLSSVQKGKAKERDGGVEALRTKDENGVKETEPSTSKLKEKRKQGKDDDKEGDVRPRKKSKSIPVTGEGLAAAAQTKKAKLNKEGKRSLVEDGEEENNKPAPKFKKLKKGNGDTSQKRLARPEPSTSASTFTSNSKPSPHSSGSKSQPSPTKPQPTAPKDSAVEEILGMLIETMATSRASSMPASSLYKSALLTRPSLSSQRSEPEWLVAIESTLHHGEARGVFGKVESSFKDEAGRPLEAQWFYVPEGDEDQERAALVRSMMPRAGKRSETKKYKQYYWRPLAKISRWDPEDDL